jgi:hypothetical protein
LEQKPTLFDELIKKRNNGKWIDNWEKEYYIELKETITPAVVLALKMRLKMSDRKYELLRSILKRRYDHNNSSYVTKELKSGRKFPNLFPTLKVVKEFEQSLRSLHIVPTQKGYHQSMKDLILSILQMPELRRNMVIEGKKLKLKIGCDGFKMTRYQCK